MRAFTKRNMLLYFRDKTAVFFSLLAVLIIISLYVLFLGDMISNNLPDLPSKKSLLISWFIAGILAVTSMTTTLGSFGNLVEDRANKVYMDFYSSPIARGKLVGGYILSAVLIGVMMCMATFIISGIYLFMTGGELLSVGTIIAVMGVIILSVLASGSMVLFLVMFFETSNAFAAASTIIGTLLGFLAGIYIPIGSLPDYIQVVVKLFPVSHAAALFRQLLMEPFIIEAFVNAPAEVKESFQLDMGVYYEINGGEISTLFSVIYLIGTIFLFFFLSLFVMNRKKR